MTPTLAPPDPPVTVSVRDRLECVDLLRGLVMVLMALDHVRDFFTNATFDPLDLQKTNPALFLTRWLTHYCAPTFIFLAGTGAFLAGTRGRTKRQLAWFLLTRGLWLALLEITYVRSLGWEFNFNFHHVGAAVLWAIGWSMVVLAGLVFLPVWCVGVFGVGIVALHNVFDTLQPESWGSLGWLWIILHKGGPITVVSNSPDYVFIAAYPLIPWMGVMAAGYAFGPILLKEPSVRRRWMLGLGIGLSVLFVVLRYTNWYGNPRPWSPQSSALLTVFSFIDCHKYPPSLLYVLMTLGPSLILLSLLDRGKANLLRPLLVFGRVPLFYYLLHLPFIHFLALVAALLRYGRADWLFNSPFSDPSTAPPGNGFSLPVIYAIWIAVVLALYPICRWFAEVKRRRPDAWLSYL